MIAARKKRETRLLNYPSRHNASMTNTEKSCLIIGDGHTQKYIDMDSDYEVDDIICIHQPKHKFTKYVFTADATRFGEKESQCIARNIPLIIAEGTYLPQRVPLLQIFKSKRTPFNSGFISLEWAIEQGYKNIYTAGLDFRKEDPKEYKYVDTTVINVINNYIFLNSAQVNFFKVSDDSLICAIVKIPNKKELTASSTVSLLPASSTVAESASSIVSLLPASSIVVEKKELKPQEVLKGSFEETSSLKERMSEEPSYNKNTDVKVLFEKLKEVPIPIPIKESNLEKKRVSIINERIGFEETVLLLKDESTLKIETLETRLKFVSSELRRLKLGKVEHEINNIEELNLDDYEHPLEIIINGFNFQVSVENLNIENSFEYLENAEILIKQHSVGEEPSTEEEDIEWEDEPETKIVKLQRKGGEIIQDCDIYIGPRCFSGGWRLEKTKWSPSFAMREFRENPEQWNTKYREHIISSGLISSIEELRGKTLGCWCTAKEKCHGYVLIDLLNETELT